MIILPAIACPATSLGYTVLSDGTCAQANSPLAGCQKDKNWVSEPALILMRIVNSSTWSPKTVTPATTDITWIILENVQPLPSAAVINGASTVSASVSLITAFQLIILVLYCLCQHQLQNSAGSMRFLPELCFSAISQQ
ncbi:unnamed protein product [Sphagnum balticum]